jgi:hypothetical protein
MALMHKPVTAITNADLLALITDQEPEGKTLDYKQTLPGKKDEEKKEFLYDISSFANAAGGHLIFGVEENGGVPLKLEGLPGIDPDQEILRLEQMARDGIRPPIMGLHTAAVKLSNGNCVIIIYVPKSWNPPHQVTYQKAFRFYSRHSNGKDQMDVEELRSIFSFSESVIDKLRQFRVDRVTHLLTQGPPTKLVEGVRMITHLLPLSAFSGVPRIDLRPIENNPGALVEIIGGISYTRFNADGYVAWSDDRAYVQVFRNGCLEAVNVFEGRFPRAEGEAYLPGQAFETRLLRHINFGKRLLQSLAVEPPIVLLVSFADIKGRRIGVPPGYSTSPLDVFDREPLYIPETVVETYGEAYASEARPLIDAVWNAAGWPRSPHYDEQGNYDPNRR